MLADDKGNRYLYGMGRIGEEGNDGWVYHHGDALGSVRQLTDANGAVTLAKGYQPYGEVLSSNGDGATPYGFASEWTDAYSEMLYLRARWYAQPTGRFITRDTWEGDQNGPMSFNKWLYVLANPVNLTDPNGDFPNGQEPPHSTPCSFLISGSDRNACEKIIRGISPYSPIDRSQLPLLDYVRGECSPLSPILDIGGNTVSLPYDSKSYGYWYHWLLEFVPGWWNNQGKSHVNIVSVVKYAIGQEASTKITDAPYANAITEAFGRKAWDSQYGFYVTIGSRQSVQVRVDQGVFDMSLCVETDDGKVCPYGLNGDRFANVMNADRGVLENNSNILLRIALDIFINMAWRTGLQPDRPQDWANLQDSNSTDFKNAVWYNAPTYDGTDYCADRKGMWYTGSWVCHLPGRKDTQSCQNLGYTDYVLTQEQFNYWCPGQPNCFSR